MRRIATLVAALVTLAAAIILNVVTSSAGARPSPQAPPGGPDQVLEWNQELLAAVQAPGAQPSTVQPTRTLAITQLSVYRAVIAVLGHSLNSPRELTPLRITANAAAASAAHTALVALLPSQRQALDARFAQSLAESGLGPRVTVGVVIGDRAAKAELATRANDGSAAAPPPYLPQPGPGEYRLTPPNFPTPVFTNWGTIKPFVLQAGDQFRPAPPPALTSARYTDDFNEVKSLGQDTSTARSAEQTDIGRFWGAAGPWIVLNQIGWAAATGFHNGLLANARMFALLDVSLADGVIALYDAKYAYHRWRPVTAVRAADLDGNPDTVANPNWLPLANTAPDPTYPGAHAEVAQSGAAALRDFFGTDRLDFALTNPNVPGVVRTFHSFSQAADEAAASRIYAGQHFRSDEDAGQALGEEVADYVAGRGV
jgi:hypothetical protein